MTIRFSLHCAVLTILATALLFAGSSAGADDDRMAGRQTASASGSAPEGDVSLTYSGRDMYIHIPARLPPPGSRALVVALHGGMGNARRIAGHNSSGLGESNLNLDAVADKYGFIVAYMNGTPVTRLFGDDKKGWNAGLCCGQSAASNIDDVGYISGAVHFLADKYGIDPARVYGIGHSNGAMMTQRIMCETALYAAGVSMSGTLEIETGKCPGARGKRLLELHGSDDKNVPMAGGRGAGISGADFKSQAYAKQVFTNSGAQYTLQVVPGAQHRLDTIASVIESEEGINLGEKIARFFGLDRSNQSLKKQ